MTPAVRVPPSACTTVQFDEDLPLAQLLPGRCITGAGGSGKTALALRLASELRPAFAERVWLIELAPLADPSLVLSTVAAALGVRIYRAREGVLEAIRARLRPAELKAARRAGQALSLDDTLQQARRAIERLSAGAVAAAAASGAAPVALSPREREVGHFVAHGLTDRQIAGALGIAVSTVGVHVHQVLRNSTSAPAGRSRVTPPLPAPARAGPRSRPASAATTTRRRSPGRRRRAGNRRRR